MTSKTTSFHSQALIFKLLMKKVITFCLLFTGWFQVLHSQDYSPMTIEDAHWFIFDPGQIFPGPEWEYYIKGDTIIDSKTYKKVYQRNFFQDDSTYATPYPYIIEEEALFGAIRDDTILRKVYMVRFPPTIGDYSALDYCPLQEEFLLYDFDAEPGDTLTGLCLFYGETENIFIDSIKSIELFGYTLRTIFCQSEAGYGPVEYAERIGFYESGVFYADWLYNSYHFLKKYCVGADCGQYLGNEEPIRSSNQFRAYPNPASSHLLIDFINVQTARDHRIQVANSIGTILIDIAFPKRASPHIISVESWPPGIYFIQFILDGTPLGVERIVVL